MADNNNQNNPNNPKEYKLEIRAGEEVADGAYSNFIIANHSETEFTLDFIFVPPQGRKANVKSRILLNPIHAKRLHALLTRQIENYEKRFGEIPTRLANDKTNPPETILN